MSVLLQQVGGGGGGGGGGVSVCVWAGVTFYDCMRSEGGEGAGGMSGMKRHVSRLLGVRDGGLGARVVWREKL